MSGFTFGVLQAFSLLAGEAKLSAQRYYNVLVSLTNPAAPEVVPDRYREFTRVSREWQHLQDLKRSGSLAVQPSKQPAGDLAIRCPACPQPNVNYIPADVTNDDRYLYVFHISYDGSFQLYRKSKTSDSWDLCLSDSRKYFVTSAAFQAFFACMNDMDAKASTRDADCNNHKAANNQWVKFTGVSETGMGATICACHSFFLPQGSVNFTTGERYLYADYVFGSVLNQALSAGVDSVGVHYDIMCHYCIKMWERWAKLPHPVGPLSLSDFQLFLAAIPKFHLAGHTEQCYHRFSLNNMTGVGRLDAEGGERCWSNLNQAAGSTKEKGPGSRVDALNHTMQQWNWMKTVDM
ncbi:hypothetical protein FRC08_015153, partial [Ceratobasidium sp. 394]